jgi:hypothetical protein
MVFNKSSLLKFGLALGIAVPMFIASPLVFANSNSTVVRGNVYNESNGGKGIGGLTVTVQCFANKKKTPTKTAVTDNFGLYTVTFNPKCDQGDSVTSTVTFNGQTQSETAGVSGSGTETNDFYFGSTSVPEMNGLALAVAFIGSVGLYMFLKKKSFV